jgi:transcriptional regulator with XRE-family HTH domain
MFIRLPGLRQEREKRGLSAWKLSQVSGVGYNTVRRLEAGHAAQEKTARKLAKALGAEFKDLIEPDFDALSREEQARAFLKTRAIDEWLSVLPNELVQLVAIQVHEELQRRSLTIPVLVDARPKPDAYIEATPQQREELRQLHEVEKE